MIWLLAELDRDEALAKGWWNLSMIVLVTLLTVMFFVVMFLLRRWKQRQLKAIDEDRAARRAGQSADRVDAWQASSERYVDHDKLTEEDELFRRDEEEELDDEEPDDDDDLGPSANPGGMGSHDEEEDRDPFGLFSDKPYQEADDDDEDFDEDEEDDEDWDGDEEDDETR